MALSGAATNSTSASASSGPRAVRPRPPAAPRPANLPPGLRFKFVNHSVSSLATAMETRDNMQDIPLDYSDAESALLTDSDCDSDSGNVSPKSGTLGEVATIDEVEDNSGGAAASDAETDDLSRSCCSERDVDELDELLKEHSLGTARQPLVKLEEGILAPTELPRCPPISWLRVAGYEVPSSKGFDSAPVAPVCGERPKRYLNLFCRQMLERTRTSNLTVGALSRHERQAGHSRHLGRLPQPRQADAAPGAGPAEVLAQHGEWLEAFVAKARAVPLCSAAEALVGEDVGAGVAAFLDTLSDVSGAGASLAEADDLPDGLHVAGPKIRTRPVHRGNGRPGFHVDLDATVLTPGRSQSPPPRPAPPPLAFDMAAMPLIGGPVQAFSQRFA